MPDRTIFSLTALSPWGFTRLARAAAPLSTGGPAGGRITRPALRRSPAPGPAPLAGLSAKLRTAWRRHRTRTCLAELNPHLLKDIGVTYAEAEAEANKPFWVA
jgi:uncharacterized protein YjiS (DUF1127 family)